ncbi:MAG: DUF4367 domain-containing protein [Clostridia bacterium]|nr:DUF4367 domain-containing protein [Clostridia bacterium]
MTAENLKLIKDALYIVAREENEAIERAIASSPKPPESLYKKCDEMVDELLKKQKRCLPIKKAITILIASAILISVFAIAAYALRDKIGGFFVDFFEKYVYLSTDHTDSPTVLPSDVSVTYIPETFEETRRDIGHRSGVIEWKDNNSTITLQISCLTNRFFAIDNENSDYTLIELGELSLHRTEKYGQTNVTWTDEKMVYTLATTGVEWDEMVKIIEGIRVEE